MSVGMEGSGPNPRTYSRAEYAALEAENARLRQAMQRLVTTHCAASMKSHATDAELEQYLAAGIAQLEAERDALRAELAEVKGREAVPVAVVKENPYCPEGTSDELNVYLPAGTKLYTTPPAATSEAQANTSEAAPGVVGLVQALEASDEYLSDNRLNEIGSGSILHRQMQDALSTWRQAQVKP